MATGPASLEVSLEVGLNRISLGASRTDPLTVRAVFSPEVLLDPDQVAERVAGIMVETAWLRTHIHTFPRTGETHPAIVHSLEQLPWNLVPPSVHLQILVPLKPLVADLAHVAI